MACAKALPVASVAVSNVESAAAEKSLLCIVLAMKFLLSLTGFVAGRRLDAGSEDRLGIEAWND
ncbi:MAG: hypothetical protein ACTHL1_05390 [Burkholderiaceae bacterium]